MKIDNKQLLERIAELEKENLELRNKIESLEYKNEDLREKLWQARDNINALGSQL